MNATPDDHTSPPASNVSRWGRARTATGRRVARSSGLVRVLLAITLAGTGWLAWDIVTDSDPSPNGARLERIDAYVSDERNDARIPGVAVAVVEDGLVTHRAGFGHDGNGNPVTADTPFWIGSNTKSITALAIMQLAEAGTVVLDTPVQQYLPQFRVADDTAARQITVRHLLNQTSGISRHDGLAAVIGADADQSIQDVVAGMADLELNRSVGERFEYANLNSVVLGAVIEAVTGESWQDYVQTNIFDPLAMTTTFTDHDAAIADGLTATHRFFFGYPIESDPGHYPGLAPTGYVYSSADDMARYLSMYLEGGELDGHRVLSEDGITDMLTAATDERTFPLQSQQFSARYGAGWFVGPFGAADDARWHQGSLPEFTAWMVLSPDTGQAVIVMINAGNQFEIGEANAAWSRIPQGVVNLLRDTDPPTGVSTARFFIVFDSLVVLALVAQAWALARVATRRPRGRSTSRRVAPLAWELLIAPLVMIAYPAVTGGFGWPAAFRFVPDLSLAVLLITVTAVLTGVTRAAKLIRSRTSPPAEVDPRVPTDPHQPSGPPRQLQD